MLRLFFLGIGILLAISLKAQDWFPANAEWYYNQVIIGSGNSFQHLKVTGETTINGKNCKIIAGLCQCSYYDYENYLYEEEERIYIYIPQADSFRILYDFSLMPGDTFVYTGDPEIEGNGIFLIDSITTMQNDTHNLRVQHISYIDGYLQYGDKIIEKIGSNGCLFPVIGICDPGTAGLRCYEDDETGLINFQDSEMPCDYTSVATSVPEESQSLTVYPNPTSSTLNIKSKLIINEIELFNSLSKLSYQNLNVGLDHVEVNFGHLPPGFYFIKVTASDNNFKVHPIVIQ